MENSPVPYDIMRDLAVRLSGRYVAWMNRAKSEAEEAHWQQEHFRVMREVKAVDAYDADAIEKHTIKIREEFASLPIDAPELPTA